jgi:NHLM bacteriocin system ABC transporter ATP-binding protein
MSAHPRPNVRDVPDLHGPRDLSGGTAWTVANGHVDVFVTSLADGEVSGPRRFLFRAGAGQFVSALPPRDPGSPRACLLGVTSFGASLQAIDDDEWSRHWASTSGVARAQVARWCRDLFAHIEPAERPGPARPRLTSIVSAEEAVDVSASTDIVWVRPRSGTACLFGDPDVPLPADALYPIAGAGWVRILGEAEVLEAGDVFSWDEARDGVAALQRHVERLAWRQVTDLVERQHQRRLERRELNGRGSKVAFLETAASLGQIAVTPAALPAAADSGASHGRDDAVWAAAGLIGEKSGVMLVRPVGLPANATTSARLDATARLSRCRIRKVALQSDWWKADYGPLLGFAKETQAPLALVPSSPGAYRAHDVTSGRIEVVTAAAAAAIELHAYVFYQPFPARRLTLVDVAGLALRHCRRELIAVMAIGSLAGVLASLTPLATGILVDSVIPTAQRDHLVEWMLLLTSCGVAAGLFQLARAIVLIRVEMKTNTAVQAAVWDRVISLPTTFFRQYSIGDLAVRTNGIEQIRQTVSGATLRAVLGGVFSIFNFAVLFWFSATLALGATALIAVAVAITCAAGYLQLGALRESSRLRAKASGVILQLLTAVAKLRLASAEERAFLRWARMFASQRRLQMRVRAIANSFATFNAVFPTITSIVIFALIARSTAAGAALRTGDFVAFMSGFTACLSAALQMGSSVIAILGVLPQYELAKPILETPPEAGSEKTEAPPLKGRIDVEHVTFRYTPDGPPILDDVSLQIKAGEFVALVGPSGSGKSTLLRMLLGFETPASGVVCYDGQDLQMLDPGSVRRQLGVVLQSGRLVPGDLMTNIIGCTTATAAEAWEAARAAALERDIRAMPMGMHTAITEGGGQISGGQRQRVLIARAIVARPRVIFFDEATSALDNAMQSVVTRNLTALGATRIVVAHRLSTIVDADTIVVLEKGRIVESGRYDELVARDGLFASLARRQQL